MLKHTLVLVVILGIAIVAISPAMAQNDRVAANARLTSLIQARIESQRPLELSAETITLTGDTLRLVGRPMIRFDDTSIRAEEIVVNAVTKRIELIGSVNASLGSDLAPRRPPIDFR